MKKQVGCAAVLTIHRIPQMSNQGRRNICNWLRKLAKDIDKEPEIFSNTFRARYLYNKITDKEVCAHDFVIKHSKRGRGGNK